MYIRGQPSIKEANGPEMGRQHGEAVLEAASELTSYVKAWGQEGQVWKDCNGQLTARDGLLPLWV